jgi:hypothetical protein
MVQKTELVRDGYLSPEGAALTCKSKAGGMVSVMFCAGFLYITERKAENDSYMGASYGFAEKVSLGLTYFFNKKGMEEEVDFKRPQADLAIRF